MHPQTSPLGLVLGAGRPSGGEGLLVVTVLGSTNIVKKN